MGGEMVKRRNNFSLIETPDGEIEGGKWVESEPQNFIIEGRIQILGSIYKYNKDGDEISVTAKFYTDQEPLEGAGFLICNDVKYHIVDWIPKQTHNLILLTR
jgi:hypothetical protein